MPLPTKYSVSMPIEVVTSGGLLVRQVDLNGVALDDATFTYGVALPVMPVNSVTGFNEDTTLGFGVWRKVTIHPNGFPVIRVDGQGNASAASFGAAGLRFNVVADSQYLPLLAF